MKKRSFESKIENLQESAEFKLKVEHALLTHVYGQMGFGLVGSSICGVVVFIGLLGSINPYVLWSWFVLFSVVAIARFMLLKMYTGQEDTSQDFYFWRNSFVIMTLMGGLTWGLSSCLIFPSMNGLQQMLCVFIVIGVTAVAVPVLAAVLCAAIGYVLLAIGPFVIQILFIHNFIYSLFDVALFFYLIFSLALAVRTHRMIKNVIRLRFEKDALLEKFTILATHDPLTQVHNSTVFFENLDGAIRRSARNSAMVGVLYVDIDNFKWVNDTFGHDFGDKVLLKVVEIMRAALGSKDQIARLGGDEFTVIIEQLPNKTALVEIAEKICQCFSTPLTCEDKKIDLSVSIGISVFPLDGHDADLLSKASDDAMYYVKAHGRGNYCFYSDIKE